MSLGYRPYRETYGLAVGRFRNEVLRFPLFHFFAGVEVWRGRFRGFIFEKRAPRKAPFVIVARELAPA